MVVGVYSIDHSCLIGREFLAGQGKSRESRIAIVGAGPAGLSAGYFLKKKGYKNVTIFERLGRVGGMCCSITEDG